MPSLSPRALAQTPDAFRAVTQAIAAERDAKAALLASVVLEDDRQRVNQGAAIAADRFDRDVRRLIGQALVLEAEKNGADLLVEQLNARLRAAGRTDLIRTASDRVCHPMSAALIAEIVAALRERPTDARR